MASAYSRSVIAEIKKEARRMFPDMHTISHILPRVYCVAKPAPGSAVFAVPEVDRDPGVRDLGFEVSGWRSEKTRELEVGDWASLAHIQAGYAGGLEVILVHKRNPKGMTFSGVPAGMIVDKEQKRRKK